MDCKCKIEFDEKGQFIQHCPLHAATEELLGMLQAVTLAAKMDRLQKDRAWKNLLESCDELIAKAEPKERKNK